MVTGTDDLGPLATHATNVEPGSYGNSGLVPYTWFKDCTSPTAGDGTEFTAQWANRLLKYIRRACDGMGIVRDEGDTDRLLKAIQKAVAVCLSLGAGHVIFAGVDGSGRYTFKSLVAGTNCSITHDGNEITINALATGGSPPGAASVGTAPARTLKGLNGATNNYEFRSITGINGISVTLVGDDIQVDGAALASVAPTPHCMGGGTSGFTGPPYNVYYYTWNACDLPGLWEIQVPGLVLTGYTPSIGLQASFDGGASYQGIGYGVTDTIQPGAGVTHQCTLSLDVKFVLAKCVRAGGGATDWAIAVGNRISSGFGEPNLSGLAAPKMRLVVFGAEGGVSWPTPPTLCRLF